MKKTKEKSYPIIIIIMVVISVAIGVLLAVFLNNIIDKAVYNERKGALVQLAETSASSINNEVAIEWEIARVYKNDVQTHLKNYSNVYDYLTYLNSQISNNSDYYCLVDSTGKYYSSDGESGRIVNTNYYVDEAADEVEYLDSMPHMKDDVTYLILRSRLDEPVTISSGGSKVTIKYCCLLHNMSSLIQHINSLFDGNNNTIIYDTDTGLMLYKQFGIRLLIDGYNVYEKYRIAEFAYGSVGEEIIEEIKNKKTNVSLIYIGDEKYYICSSPLEVSNWTLLLVIEGEYFNSESGQAYANIVTILLVILGIATILIIILFWYFNRLKANRKALADEYKVNEALNEAYKIKSEFLSYMSHDIRTPINGTIGMAQIGIANSQDKEKVEECFRKIDLSSKHLLAIVNDVLDMSAIEAGKIVIQSEKMNIIKTLEGCRDIIVGLLENRQLTIEEDYNCTVTDVLGDEFHLKQVIINILSNAVKFTEDGGTIKISCRQLETDNETVNYSISISDTGIGMSEEFQKHIFEAFRMANEEGKTRYKGSGLGMAISYEYVKMMNGTITVDSKPGVGSTFTINLPFKIVEETAEHCLEEFNVLLVDDNEINLEITREMLKDHVRSIQVAHNGQEALEAFMASNVGEIDLILMDVQMPVMNGTESAKAIRSSGRVDHNVNILALTANTYKDDIDAVLESGMNGYLNKPFSVEQLLDKIKRKDET